LCISKAQKKSYLSEWMDVSSQEMSYMLELVGKLLDEPDHDLKRKSIVLMQPDSGMFIFIT
jgi:hypothetical protein